MSEQIQIYTLAPPKEIVANGKLLAMALFGMRDLHDGDRELSISEVSGCISYRDGGQLWKNRNPGGLAPDATRAQKLAEDWIAGARQRLAKVFARGSQFMTQILPPTLEHDVSATVNNSAGAPDHWLSSFNAILSTNRLGVNDTRAAVDCVFELRMGAGGVPVALVSTWRPFASKAMATLVPGPDGAQLIYRMQAPQAPQQWIAPYWLLSGRDVEGNTAELVPATDTHSPFILLLQETFAPPVRIRAVVTGVSGPLSYVWGRWRIDDPVSGFQQLDERSSVLTLDTPGVCNVVVDVGTGRGGALTAVVRGEMLIFSGPGTPPLVA